MKVYNKLVRDRIPEIIEYTGQSCKYRTLQLEEFLRCLDEKLLEELKEYQASGEIEELADMFEVMLAIMMAKNVSLEQFEQIRGAKKKQRGGFERRLFLESVE